MYIYRVVHILKFDVQSNLFDNRHNQFSNNHNGASAQVAIIGCWTADWPNKCESSRIDTGERVNAIGNCTNVENEE